MTNCSVCHDTPSALSAANAMPVTGAGCFSCHGSMESWEEDFAASGTTFHNSMTRPRTARPATTAPAPASRPATVTDFHNGIETERVGIIWDGEDLSVTEGAKFNWAITKVADDKTSGNL